MISKILNEVSSPFTDESIKDLIEKYIACGCDDNLFYNKINELEKTDKSTSAYTRALINKIYSQGMSKSEIYQNNDKDNIPLIYDSNNSWVILYSEEDPMKDQQRTSDNKTPLIYRIYLNLKDIEKTELVENYVKRCKESKIPFELKFSKDESRLDQIVILSRSDNLEKNVSMVEELTKKMKLGNLPKLIGKYNDNNIGIAEEYYNRLYSPTKVKLVLVRSSIKKYLCDHVDEFGEKLSDEEKEKINEYIREFASLYESEKEEIEELDENYEDFKKNYYQEKNTIDCAKEHIENDHDAYVCKTGLVDLNNAINQIYSNNSEQFIKEIVQNYRLIGTQVWGFAQDFIFTNETEKKCLKTKENENYISVEQIGSELETISRTGLVDKVQGDLISMMEEKEEEKTKERGL